LPASTPSILPSGTTFAQLRAGGFHGQLERLAVTNGFPPAVLSLLIGDLDTVRVGIVQAVDAFLQGEPVNVAELGSRLSTSATALRALTAAVDEIITLIGSNPGTLANLPSPINADRPRRRVFP
jgi:hypothetical protein